MLQEMKRHEPVFGTNNNDALPPALWGWCGRCPFILEMSFLILHHHLIRDLILKLWWCNEEGFGIGAIWTQPANQLTKERRAFYQCHFLYIYYFFITLIRNLLARSLKTFSEKYFVLIEKMTQKKTSECTSKITANLDNYSKFQGAYMKHKNIFL